MVKHIGVQSGQAYRRTVYREVKHTGVQSGQAYRCKEWSSI